MLQYERFVNGWCPEISTFSKILFMPFFIESVIEHIPFWRSRRFTIVVNDGQSEVSPLQDIVYMFVILKRGFSFASKSK
jgi:hypothetical protein